MSVAIVQSVAPFKNTDSVVQPGYQVWRYANGSTTPAQDGSHTITGISFIPGQVNGYSALVSCTLDTDGGYRGFVEWDSGGGTPIYRSDEINIIPKAGATTWKTSLGLAISSIKTVMGDSLSNIKTALGLTH